MEASLDKVKLLRERTAAGMLDCKKALNECGGDIEAAIEHLRKRGIAKASRFTARKAADGLVHAYIHPGNKVGVILEVNCETDFVARTDDFRNLVNDLALQIVATAPLGLARENIDPAVVEKEKEIYKSQAMAQGKPEKIAEKMVEGKLEKFFEEACLLEQQFVKDPERRVGDLVKEVSGKVGENVVVRRFARFQLGEAS